ncbi:MAG TPA: prepilin-type N-terminal cleavage/methylation domain-containing protein [Thermoanaerobaculia bacterium]|jgi:prepilin-type N-terminal cleavage/methylation domain-containing protein
MWRSSHNRRGFTLIEAMVSLLLLVIVLTVAMTMLFQMRAFAERQQFFMLPRQAARRATEYLSYYVASASDVNDVQNNPNALITYYNLNGSVLQASYDNLTGAEPGNAVTTPNVTTKFGDIGTDVITLVAPINPAKYRVSAPFPGFSAGAKSIRVNFRVGCGGPAGTDDVTNMAQFKAATGFDGANSALLMFEDTNGEWSYFQIPAAGYISSNCADVTTYRNILVQAVIQSATLPAPPNGGVAAFSDPVSLVTGLQFISFRVRTDPVDNLPKLQQKIGLFNPNTDNPGVEFVNVMENVEDLQVAYVYANGDIWNNTAGQTISQANAGARCNVAACDNRVPPQAGPGAVTQEALDVTGVIGLRFSITARSPRISIGARQLTNVNVTDVLTTTTSQHFRPASENHPVTMDTLAPLRPLYDLFDHYRATSTMLLRNRTLGS